MPRQKTIHSAFYIYYIRNNNGTFEHSFVNFITLMKQNPKFKCVCVLGVKLLSMDSVYYGRPLFYILIIPFCFKLIYRSNWNAYAFCLSFDPSFCCILCEVFFYNIYRSAPHGTKFPTTKY